FCRFPWPAASMTTESGMTAPGWCGSALFAQLSDGLQLCHGARQLCLRFGDIDPVGAAADRFFGAGFCGLGRCLVKISGAGGGVGQYGNPMRLNLERAP